MVCRPARCIGIAHGKIERRWIFGERLHLSAALEFHGCVAFFSGSDGSTLDFHGEMPTIYSESWFNQLRDVNYFLFQFGLVYDLALRRTE